MPRAPTTKHYRSQAPPMLCQPVRRLHVTWNGRPANWQDRGARSAFWLDWSPRSALPQPALTVWAVPSGQRDAIRRWIHQTVAAEAGDCLHRLSTRTPVWRDRHQRITWSWSPRPSEGFTKRRRRDCKQVSSSSHNRSAFMWKAGARDRSKPLLHQLARSCGCTVIRRRARTATTPSPAGVGTLRPRRPVPCAPWRRYRNLERRWLHETPLTQEDRPHRLGAHRWIEPRLLIVRQQPEPLVRGQGVHRAEVAPVECEHRIGPVLGC